MKPSKLEWRILTYLFIWFIATIIAFAFTLYISYTSDDPSALAWLYFLPYLFPMFAAQSLIFTVPLIAVGEAALALYKYFKKNAYFRRNQRLP